MKITDIKIEREYFKRERDILGNVVRTPYTRMIPREVNIVSVGVRFGYFLIDLVFIYLMEIIIGMITALVVINTNNLEQLSPGHATYYFLNFLGYISFFLYYAICESSFGSTLGKLICGYTVIDEYAEKPATSTVLLRTLCRYIPFEAFSCFNERGWHDTFTKTYVVKKKEKTELQHLLQTIHQENSTILS